MNNNAFGLPNQVEFCHSCVISNQRPITSIESKHNAGSKKITTRFTNGICDACRWANIKKEIDWAQREEELAALCNKFRRADGGYDVIVPASGGKDSRFVAHLLRHKYGMNPLTVTWKPHLYTDIGLTNLWSMIDNGFDNRLVSPNGKVQRKLARLAFENLGHPFQPFICGQRVVGPRAALDTGAKLVFYGENVAEYGNRIEDNLNPRMPIELFTCFDFYGEDKKLDEYFLSGVSLADLMSIHGISRKELNIYNSPSEREIVSAGVEVHYMSYYKNWVPQENYYYAVEHTGFTPNPVRRDGSYGKYAGIDDKMEDLHYYMQVIKFGMGRATWDAAQEIRTEKITREEGVALVRKYDLEAPKTFLPDILEYLDLSEQEFWDIVNKFRSPHLWDKGDDGIWFLKNLID
ncbi:N-acetyl sugar amidotransferase [Polynucleobacter sp.]|uniref:N-acetyl sugar amidotransferase n=1 Tax=Polynucleobacter sp. TaxID=2029855 RepID=UPI003F6986F2